MALTEFTWQNCHTKFIQELQDVITTSSVLNWDKSIQRPKFSHEEINSSICNGPVFVLVLLRTSSRYTWLYHLYTWRNSWNRICPFSPCPLTVILKFYLFFNYGGLVTFPIIAELVHLLEIKRLTEKVKIGIYSIRTWSSVSANYTTHLILINS